jgi:hypothetical protein
MKSSLQLDRYHEVWDAADSTITEVAHDADDLRKVSEEHGVRVAHAANVDS